MMNCPAFIDDSPHNYVDGRCTHCGDTVVPLGQGAIDPWLGVDANRNRVLAPGLPQGWKYNQFMNTLDREDGLSVAAVEPHGETIRQVELSERQQSMRGDFIFSTAPMTLRWLQPSDAASWGVDLTAGSAPVIKFNAGTSELRPPAEHEGAFEHFLRHPLMLARGLLRDMEVAAWDGQMWLLQGDETPRSPAELAEAGWSYLGPAEWRPEGWTNETARKHNELFLLFLARGRELDAASDRIAELEAEIVQLRRRHSTPGVGKNFTNPDLRQAAFNAAECAQAQINAAGAVEEALAQCAEFGDSMFHAVGPVTSTLRRDAATGAWSETSVSGDRPAPPRKGEFVTCENGHLVCEIAADLLLGAEQPWPGLGAWRANADKNGLCGCGKPWFRYRDGMTCSDPQLHIKGRGWV
jgi:hypothetical protein